MDSWLIRNIEKVSKWSGLSASWLVVPLVAVVVYEVIVRKYFSPTTWAFELSYMIYGAHFMLLAAYCLYKGQHVRTDLWYGSWSPRTQGIVDSVLYLFLFLPGMVCFLWLSIDYWLESFLLGETSPFSPWRPIIWPFYAVLPITVALILLQGIAELLKSIRRVRGIEGARTVSEVYDES